MLNLMLVDDEPHWVDSLAETTPWNQLGIDAVYRAYSAYEALELLDTYPIDIVITDILMPQMNGLELIAKINEDRHGVKCIVLTGHSEFEYAKQAVQKEVFDYLLKPVRDEELFDVVRRTVVKLQEEWDKEKEYNRSVHTLKEHLPVLKGLLLQELLSGRKRTAIQWRQRAASLGVRLNDADTAVLLLIRREDGQEATDEFDGHLMDYAIANIAEELFQPLPVWYCKDERDYLVFTVASGSSDKSAEKAVMIQLERMSVRLQHKVKQYLNRTVSVLISGFGQFPHDLPAMYEQAIYAFRQRVGEESDFLMKLEDRKENAVESLNVLYQPPGLIHLLEAGRWDAAVERVDAVFDELQRRWSESHEHVMEAGFAIAGAFTNIAHKNGRRLSEMAGKPFNDLAEGFVFRSISGLREWTHHMISLLRVETSNELKLSRSAIVRKVQEYAETHLHLDVSLQTIADLVYVHPTHLSKLYKRETGEGISEFICRLRMEKASYMLNNTEKKVYEIGSALGYMNAAYFIKVFKKYYGVTPQEFKDRRPGVVTDA